LHCQYLNRLSGSKGKSLAPKDFVVGINNENFVIQYQ
jgi:hypothetical protein